VFNKTLVPLPDPSDVLTPNLLTIGIAVKVAPKPTNSPILIGEGDEILSALFQYNFMFDVAFVFCFLAKHSTFNESPALNVLAGTSMEPNLRSVNEEVVG
jgi:hypothetical protein